MIVQKAMKSEISDVARLHMQAFPGFFLTSLGLAFLEELYTGFLSHSSGIFLVAKVDGQIVGFAAGTAAPKEFFSDLRARRALFFVFKAAPYFLKNPIFLVKRLFSAFRYQGDAPESKPSGALLSSIGVSSNVRGCGISTCLLNQFEKEAKNRHAEYVYLTTDAENNERVNAFYRKHGYFATSNFLQTNSRLMIRYEKYLN